MWCFRHIMQRLSVPVYLAELGINTGNLWAKNRKKTPE
jgi:hypothetical protein